MGGKASKFSQEELDEYRDVTYLSESEICTVFDRFQQLAPHTVSQKRTARLPKNVILKIQDLKCNPFRERICKVFSATGDGSMDFDDVLDMMSVFSANAPRSVKVMYAFKVYDFNEDGVICQKDVSNIVQTLCGQRKWGKGELETIVDNVFKETDMDANQELDFSEFENMITKTPDFLSSFRFGPIS